jgi:hypothetical protein
MSVRQPLAYQRGASYSPAELQPSYAALPIWCTVPVAGSKTMRALVMSSSHMTVPVGKPGVSALAPDGIIRMQSSPRPVPHVVSVVAAPRWQERASEAARAPAIVMTAATMTSKPIVATATPRSVTSGRVQTSARAPMVSASKDAVSVSAEAIGGWEPSVPTEPIPSRARVHQRHDARRTDAAHPHATTTTRNHLNLAAGLRRAEAVPALNMSATIRDRHGTEGRNTAHRVVPAALTESGARVPAVLEPNASEAGEIARSTRGRVKKTTSS